MSTNLQWNFFSIGNWNVKGKSIKRRRTLLFGYELERVRNVESKHGVVTLEIGGVTNRRDVIKYHDW